MPAASGDPGENSPIIETPEARLERERVASRHSRVLVIAGAVVVLAVGFGLTKLFIAAPPAPALASPQEVVNALPDDSPEARQAFDVAVSALSQPGWAEAFPYFRDSGRLRPVMERYHAKNEWHALQLTELAEARLEDRDGHQWVLLTAKTERHRTIVLALEKTAEGWKLDWEALADAPGFEWQEFYQQRPATPQHLRVEAIRGSVSDAYIATAGAAAKDVLPVSLFCRHRGDAVIALVRKDSDLGKKLDAQLQWDTPLRMIADISVVASCSPPLVTLHKVAETPWSDPLAKQSP